MDIQTVDYSVDKMDLSKAVLMVALLETYWVDYLDIGMDAKTASWSGVQTVGYWVGMME